MRSASLTVSKSAVLVGLVVAVCCQLAGNAPVEAGQGCPFDDGSCQEYCSQQGCNMGYCGHFAWIQCICRKCGDEWSWYDKVHYKPDKTVNQTELDSLKLNATSPLILTNSSSGLDGSNSTLPLAGGPARAGQPGQVEQVEQVGQQQQQQQRATLTTLLIPDLSDNSKLDLNDIPDENSDKFLDYLAKNHERLVQATSSKDQKRPEDQLMSEETAESSTLSTSAASSSSSSAGDDETVEIQISSNNNNSSPASQQTTDSPSTSQPPASSSSSSASLSQPSAASSSSSSSEHSPTTTSQPQPQQQQQQQQPTPKSPLIRLLHMASEEQLFESGEQ